VDKKRGKKILKQWKHKSVTSWVDKDPLSFTGRWNPHPCKGSMGCACLRAHDRILKINVVNAKGKQVRASKWYFTINYNSSSKTINQCGFTRMIFKLLSLVSHLFKYKMGNIVYLKKKRWVTSSPNARWVPQMGNVIAKFKYTNSIFSNSLQNWFLLKSPLTIIFNPVGKALQKYVLWTVNFWPL
jgi:hypothetical protein